MRRLALALVVVVALVVVAFFALRPRGGESASFPTKQTPTASEPARAAALAPELPPIRDDAPAEVVAPAESARTAQGASQVAIHVVDEHAQPVADVPIQLRFQSDAGQWVGNGAKGFTDSKGECVLAATPLRGDAGAWLIVWPEEPDGYVDSSARVPVGTERVEIALRRGARLSGKVSYVDGSLPSPQSQLLVWRADQDGNATYEHADVIQGAYDFGPWLAGAYTRAELRDPRRSGAAQLDIALPLEPGANVQRDFVFDIGATLVVTFRDAATGELLEGARVTGLPRAEDPRPASDHYQVRISLRGERLVPGAKRSDADGQLVFTDALDAGSRTVVEFACPGYAPEPRELVVAPGSRTLAVDVALERALELSGIVEDAHGVPQPRMFVRFQRDVSTSSVPLRRASSFSAHVMTDAEGHFRIGGVPPRGVLSFFACRVDAHGRRVGPLAFETITLPEAASRQRWVVLDGATLRGRVISAQGDLPAEMSMQARLLGHELSSDAALDSAGNFEVDEAVPGKWRLTFDYGPGTKLALDPESVRQRATVDLDVPSGGASGILVRLPPPRTEWPQRALRVRFFDRRTHVELDAVEWVQWTGLDSTLSFGTDARDLRRAPLRQGLVVGRYAVDVRAVGYAPAASELEVLEGDGVQDVELALDPEDG